MPRGTLLVRLALAALLVPADGQTFVGPEYIPTATHPLPMWLDPPKEVQAASCAIDVGIATVFLGTAGTSINAAIKTCDRQLTATDKAACSASISGVILGLQYAAGFLAAAAADCQKSLQIVHANLFNDAACAADVTTLVASLALLANSGSGMRQACGNGHVGADHSLSVNTRRLGASWKERFGQALKDHQRDLNTTQRELTARQVVSAGNVNHERMVTRSAEIAECVFDAGQATLFLARAGLMVNNAVADCAHFELRTGGRPAQALCAADVTSVISAFAFTASGIAYACFHCPFWQHVVPGCAGAVINLISALAQIAAVGASFEANCGHHGRRLNNATQPSDILV